MAADMPREISRRRTFAIISHPDAGKTTLTENLLLYSGAVRSAGSVSAKKGQRHATSDWMTMEQQRGISITSSALQFEYDDWVINLLDTPGHEDFSEDTYRTLMAVDSAVMVLDAGKGVELQTRKLFAVCRQRGIPIFTFINKMDRPGLDPFDLLNEVEKVLGITAHPLTWPIGEPGDFQGVYELDTRKMHLFERSEGNRHRAPVQTAGLHDPTLAQTVEPRHLQRLLDDLELIEGGLQTFDRQGVLSGKVTPVFFGSALTHFGVENFLQRFIDLAPAPGPMPAEPAPVAPESDFFSGFVYKIQANMDRAHRDRVAFIRVVSGRFERGMKANHVRLAREIKMSYPCRLFAGERFTIDEAFPGDVMGLVNPGIFRIGDVISSGADYQVPRFPVFPPEKFLAVVPPDPSRRKSFQKGLEQLGEEGVIQIFQRPDGFSAPVIAAVGQLQFEVFLARMAEEYQVELRTDPLPYTLCRWVGQAGYQPQSGDLLKLMLDAEGQSVLLFQGEWEIQFALKNYPDLQLHTAPEGMVSIHQI